MQQYTRIPLIPPLRPGSSAKYVSRQTEVPKEIASLAVVPFLFSPVRAVSLKTEDDSGTEDVSAAMDVSRT